MSDAAAVARPRPRGDEASIIFDHVSKKFRRGEAHDSLRDLIPALGRRLMGRAPVADPGQLAKTGEFWALEDLSFVVRPGECLGIIGSNGAGKSTALKVLTKILRATKGRAYVPGRVGALIEISAGFHPDLTGRENVFLQGAIMGMRKFEIARRFDEIVEFAEIGEFIDTPVKRYSSGMHARLGFAIAAHLDPDALIIDEVLAVGDAAFQQKAFGRLGEIVKRDIPVVVVSHQLDRVAQLCTQAILLHHGTVAAAGRPSEVIGAYAMAAYAVPPAVNDDAPGMRIEGVRLAHIAPVRSGERITVTVVARGKATPAAATVLIRIRSAVTGAIVHSTSAARLGAELPREGPFMVDFDLQLNLPEGPYTVETVVYDTFADAPITLGPGTHVHVTPGASFRGTVQLNPRATVRAVEAPPLPLPPASAPATATAAAAIAESAGAPALR